MSRSVLGAEPRIGTEVGGYRIESLCGRGGMGVVYVAHDPRLKRRVALKLVAPEVAAKDAFRERFLRETELAASLDHSHIVPVYEAGEDRRLLFLAMRYVEGEDLQGLLEREGRLEPERALEFVSQVAEALDAAHARGVVHRDVKPANVLVTREGGREHCYLTDFGLSAAAADSLGARSLHLSGSVGYASPEQILKEPIDERSDVYSLGCVLYACLAGEPPFSRAGAIETLFAHVYDEPSSVRDARPELPKAIDGVIGRALAKDPDARYGSCVELSEAARDALGLAKSRFNRRNALLAAVAAGLAVAVAVAAPAIVLTSGGRPASVLPLHGDSLVRIDPATGKPAAALSAAEARWIGVVGSSLWFADPNAKRLVRVDPRRGKAVAVYDLSRIAHPDVFETGAGAIWIRPANVGYADTMVGSARDAFWRFDPRQGSLVAVRNGGDAFFAPSDLASAGDALWVVQPIPSDSAEPSAAVLRVDPSTGRRVATVARVRQALVAAGEGAVWILDGRSLRRVDPGTNRVTGTVRVDGDLSSLFGGYSNPPERAQLAAGEGGVWLLNKDDESVARIDPATGRIAVTVRVDRLPTDIAVGEGAVWVSSARDATVTRIDPHTLDVTTIDVGGSARALAVGAGGVWVASSPSRLD